VESLLRKTIDRQNQTANNSRDISEPKLSDFVSKSCSMQIFINTVKKVIHCNSSLLILGETGVGKERLALAIHNESSRKRAPFIAVNCAALPENLLESELFGHEKGAFTGASRSRRGAFELAHNGTLFLDEIGDMPMHLQIKLLRAIQDKQFRRVGGEITVNVDARIIAATNRDLSLAVKSGIFRKDLFYRLSVITLTIPSLSERKEDIADLVHNYIKHLAPRIGVNVTAIDRYAMEALIAYNWPGNIRELINVVERALLLCEGDTISLAEIPEDICSKIQENSEENLFRELGMYTSSLTDIPWKAVKNKMRDIVEKRYFLEMLEKHNGKVSDAAANAGVTPRAFYHKLSKYLPEDSMGA
jgi:transcriptional regulator with PAS, ATPase and Fis domain